MEQGYTITIPNISREQPLLLPISPDQAYHNGPIFKAILQELDRAGVEVVIVIADELRRFNFQIELTQDSEENTVVKEQVAKLKESWIAMNLLSDPEMQALTSHMRDTKKLTIMHWDECKKNHGKAFESVVEEANVYYKSNAESSYRRMVDEAAERFFEAMVDRKKNDAIFNYFLQKKGKAFVLGAYRKYIMEECVMIVTWWRAGFEQMAYPIAYHGKGSTSEYVFSAAKFLLEYLDKAELLFHWRDISITCNQEKAKTKGPSQEMQLKQTIKQLKGEKLGEVGRRKKLEAKLIKAEDNLKNTQGEEEKLKEKISSLKAQIDSLNKTVLIQSSNGAVTPFWVGGRSSSGTVSAPLLLPSINREPFSLAATPVIKETKKVGKHIK